MVPQLRTMSACIDEAYICHKYSQIVDIYIGPISFRNIDPQQWSGRTDN